MNGDGSGTLARLPTVSGIIIAQEKLTTAATMHLLQLRERASDRIERSRFLRARAL